MFPPSMTPFFNFYPRVGTQAAPATGSFLPSRLDGGEAVSMVHLCHMYFIICCRTVVAGMALEKPEVGLAWEEMSDSVVQKGEGSWKVQIVCAAWAKGGTVPSMCLKGASDADSETQS